MAFIIGAVIGAGASLIGGAMASSAASKAAKTQAKSADKATALEKQMYEENVVRQKPFYDAGVAGQNRLVTLLGLGGDPNAEGYGSLTKSFSMDDFRADPGYAFRMKEGLKSLDATAAARGGLISGNALRAAQAFGQDLGSQEYMNAYNRYQTNRANIIDPLQKQAGQGGTTATTLGSAGQNYASSAGSNMIAAGNARASGYTGSADAWNRAMGGAAGTIVSGLNANQMYGSGYNPYNNYAGLAGGGQVPLPPSRYP